jgi:hypothetical protein
MYHVVFAHIIHAQREREIEEAIRVRRLLKGEDATSERFETTNRAPSEARTLTPRARPTGG